MILTCKWLYSGFEYLTKMQKDLYYKHNKTHNHDTGRHTKRVIN